MVTSDWGAIYKELGARPVVNATGSCDTAGRFDAFARSQRGDGSRGQRVHSID